MTDDDKYIIYYALFIAALFGTIMAIIFFLPETVHGKCNVLISSYNNPSELDAIFAEVCYEKGENYTKNALKLNGYEKYEIELP